MAGAGVALAAVAHFEARADVGARGGVLLRVVVVLLDAQALVDGGGEGHAVGGLGLAQVQGHLHPVRSGVHLLIEGGQGPGQVPVYSSETRVVQGVDEGGLYLVDKGHHGRGLGDGVVEVEVLVVDGEGPVHLSVPGRTEEVAGVVVDGVGALEPLLIETQTVGIPCLDDVPGVAKSVPELPALGQLLGEVLQHHGADGLVGVGTAEHQGVLGAVADLQAQQGVSVLGPAHLEEADRVRIVLRQGPGALVQLIDGEEALVVRDVLQKPGEKGIRCHSFTSSFHLK